MRKILYSLFLIGIIITNTNAQCTTFLTCTTQQDAQSGKCANLNRGYADESWYGHHGYNANSMTMGTSMAFFFFGSNNNTPANYVRKVISTSSVTLSNGTFKPAAASFDECFKPFLHVLIGNCYEAGPSTLTPVCGGNRVASSALAQSAVTVYPNPSKDGYFVVRTNAPDSKVTIYNAVGQSVTSSVHQEESDVYKIDLRSEKAGFYLIKVVKTDNTSETFKVLLEN